jgi:hypothetical protein
MFKRKTAPSVLPFVNIDTQQKMNQQTTETGIVFMGKTATAATYVGSAGAAASGLSGEAILGLTTSQWSVVGVIGGLAIAFLGFCVNVYFKRQHLLIAMKTSQPDLDA